MAAFPNDDHHTPVDHFIDRDSEESEFGSEVLDESTFTEIDWDLAAMRQHREALEQQQKAERERKKLLEAKLNRDRDLASNACNNPVVSLLDQTSNKNIIGGWQKDSELDRMRKGARPPMLGGDIAFPRCASPERARFDPTQRCRSLRNSSHSGDQHHTDKSGLWCSKEPSETPCQTLTLWSNPPSRAPSRGGLWGGCCKDTGSMHQSAPTGLMTPRIEIDNPLENPLASAPPTTSHFPPTPMSTPSFSHLDPDAPPCYIEDEFTDDFVTQVYNYLSLGYPSIARNFDAELSKISHIPIEELRQDDHLNMPRGYIRLGADGNLKDSDITEESCKRWRALRLYVKEWARQQPGMAGGGRDEKMAGTGVRRGSWGV
jgi:hypothetical protein